MRETPRIDGYEERVLERGHLLVNVFRLMTFDDALRLYDPTPSIYQMNYASREKGY